MIVMPLAVMSRSQVRRSMGRGLALVAMLLWGGALPGGETHASVSATCAVRMVPRAAAGYDPSTERTLQGEVQAVEAGALHLRLKAGWVRVELGSLEGALVPASGRPALVVASLQIVKGRQQWVAREVCQGGTRWTFRDERGVPVSSLAPQL